MKFRNPFTFKGSSSGNKENSGMPEMNEVTVSSVLPSQSTFPLPYVHSCKFIEDGCNVLEKAREKVRRKKGNLDWLINNKLDPVIESDSNDEISYGKLQKANHLATIRNIIKKFNGEINVANEEIALIEAEIEQYDVMKKEIMIKE